MSSKTFSGRARNLVAGAPRPRAPAMVKKVRGSLSAQIGDAQEHGLAARNVVQERLAHSSIVMTMDTYGHPFERGDDLQRWRWLSARF